MVKNLPAIQETQVRFLGWEDTLEMGMAAHSSILAWRIPRTEEPDRSQSMESQRVRQDWMTNTFYTPKRYVKVLTPSTCECDTQKESLQKTKFR